MFIARSLRGGASAVALLCLLDSVAYAQQALPTISIGPARPGLSRRPSAGVPSQGSGASSGPSQPVQEKEIVVETSTRTQKKVSEAPGDLTVFSEEYIQRRDAPRIGTIIRDAPGIYSWGNSLGYAPSSANRAGRFSFRGISGQNRTLFLMDDQIMNDPMFGSFNYSQYFMDDIQRIETLPGASSALYGANAYAGVVRAFSVVPEKREIIARGETSGGEFSRQSGNVIYRDRLANGLGWSAGGRWEGSVPFRDNVIQRTLVPPYVIGAVPTVTSQGQQIWNMGLQGEAKYKTVNAQLKLYYDYDNATSARAGVTYFQSNSMQGLFESYSPLWAYPRYNASVTPANRLLPNAFLGAGLAYESTLTAFGALRHKFSEESEIKLNINNMARVYRFTTPSVAPGSNAWALGGDGTYNNYPQNLFSANVQYSTPVKFLPFFAHQLTTGAGVDNGVAAFQQFNVKNWANFGSSNAFTSSMQAQSRFVWGFAQDEIKVNNWLTAYLGGRVDWWHTSGVRSGAGFYDNFSGQDVVNFNPKVSLVANMPWENGVLRASAGRAFRAPVLNALYVDSTRGNVRNFSNPNLKPETAISWEIGYEQYFKQTGTFAKVTYFESWLENYNSTRRLPAPSIIQTWTTTVNSGEAVIRGFEITGSQTLTDWLTAYVTYTNVAQALTLKAPDQPETVNRRLQNAPRHLFNASLEANYLDWTGTLTGRYTADSYDLATNADFVRGVYGSFDRFWQLDARVSWKPTKYTELYVAGNNMLGRYYQFTVNPGAFFTAGLKLTY
jgi:iron complex outermembrane receptor protein